MNILDRVDAVLDGLCPCGGTPRPGSAYCGYDCEPTPTSLDGDYHPPTAMRWRPDLVNDSDDTNLTPANMLAGRTGYTGRYNPTVYQRTDRDAWHLRLDNGHRYVGCDIHTEDLGDDSIIPIEMVDRIRAAWARLERELDNTRHLEPDDPLAGLPANVRNDVRAALHRRQAEPDRRVAEQLADSPATRQSTRDAQAASRWSNLYRYQPADPRSPLRNLSIT